MYDFTDYEYTFELSKHYYKGKLETNESITAKVDRKYYDDTRVILN